MHGNLHQIMPVLVLSYTQKAGSVELYGHQTESTIKRHFMVGCSCTNGRFITYNRELISVCRGFHLLIKKYMHHLALVCTMYHSVIVFRPVGSKFEMVRLYYSAKRAAHNVLGHAHLPSLSHAALYPSSRMLLLSNCV